MSAAARRRRRAAGVALALALLAAPAAPARANPVDEALRRGNEAYWRADYAAAVRAYEQVATLGVVHEDLYYNLGNAYYRLGRLGLAVFNYERALALAADEDVTYNLKVARTAVERRVRDRIQGADSDPLWQRLAARFDVGTLTWAFLGLYLAATAILFALRVLAGGPVRAALVTANVFLIAGTLVAGGLLGGRLYLARSVRFAIVLPDRVAVHDGPDAAARSGFEVHAGLRVRLTEDDQEWVKVRLANGLEGWVRGREVGRL